MLVAALLLVAGYLVALIVVPRIAPHRASVVTMSRARAAWFESIWDGGSAILFVQTYRNWLIGLNVLASAALLLGLGAMSMAFGGVLEQGVPLGEVVWSTGGAPSWRAKLVVLGVVLMTAFANFLLAVRGFNRAAILVAVPHDAVPSPAEGLAVLRSAHLHHTIALRVLCMSLPAALWVFGPDWVLVGAVVVVGFLSFMDFRFGRLPEARSTR
jgi:uncharacterized membrane protein